VRAYPSPFVSATGFRFTHPREANLAVRIYDLQGRLVRALERVSAPAGEQVLAWDGRDERGIAAPAAVYFARCELGATRVTLRIVRL
jgi:flagellar hook assembly protein FlgD